MAKRTASTKAAAGRKSARSSTSTAKKRANANKSCATKKATPKRKKVADPQLSLDRRTGDRRTAGPTASVAPALERREKVNRRRQIDPTTCERDYTDDEVEFMNALDVYKRKNGRMFPTCSEVLEVIRNLGYVKQPTGSSTVEQTNVRSYSDAIENLESASRELETAL